jgi:Protein of unknown function (DUF3160)/Secretion system C-terminal sorting domain
MKRKFVLWLCPFLLTANPAIVHGQSTFDTAAYKQYLEENRSLSPDQLLESNPPKTVYYSSRLYPAKLADIPWYDSVNSVFSLTKTEEELLANNFFMVSERLRYNDWINSLITIYNNDLPLFLSTDLVLFTLHNAYDAILQTVEWQFLEPNLKVLVESLYVSFPALYDKYKDDARLSDALADVDLYVAVAYSLANNETYLPQSHSREKYDEVMQAIDAEQMKNMALFTQPSRTREIDFSQFKPRGHYNKTIYTPSGEITLENYFRAMMWLGRIDFMLTAPPDNPDEPAWTVDELRRMKLGAVLLNELLKACGKKELLDIHEKIIGYLVGPADNLTPDELSGLTDAILESPADLFDNIIYQQFDDSLNASDDFGQKIMSNYFIMDPYSSDPGKLPVSFLLMGQKFLLDSYIAGQVVFDRIVYNGEKIFRGLPDPLDILAVLGNEDAMALLKEEMETYKYAYKIAGLKYLVDAYDDDYWKQSLYNTWLSALKELNPPVSSDPLPYFMQTTAWHQEKLNTQLTSWAALRHDNILYGKPSYTGGTTCSYPYTYVEPYPEFYDRLRQFAEASAKFFKETFEGTSMSSNTTIINYYTRYAEIMSILRNIAQKELQGVAIDEEEIVFLKTMITYVMECGPGVSGWFNDLIFSYETGFLPDFIVADIHTQPTDKYGGEVGYVYHAGSGYINNGVFLAPNPVHPEQIMAFAGPVSSFHYEVTDNFYRYNDQEWAEKFTSGNNLPPRPDWIATYIAGPQGEELPAGRELKGTVCNASGINPPSVINDVDYLLAYPNPTRGIVHLRFVLNQTNVVTVELYDANGNRVSQLSSGLLTPAEHDMQINLNTLPKGFYIVRLQAGNKLFYKKIMLL